MHIGPIAEQHHFKQNSFWTTLEESFFFFYEFIFFVSWKSHYIAGDNFQMKWDCSQVVVLFHSEHSGLIWYETSSF